MSWSACVRAPQEVKAHICLLALVQVSCTSIACAGHARDQGQVVGVAALGATCAYALHKIIADGAAAVLGSHCTAAVGAVEGLWRDKRARSSALFSAQAAIKAHTQSAELSTVHHMI